VQILRANAKPRFLETVLLGEQLTHEGSQYRHDARLSRPASENRSEERIVMVRKSNRVLDPLDLEILERAFDGAWAAFKENQFTSDAEFETLLRQELSEIAALSGANDAEAIGDTIFRTAIMRLRGGHRSDLE
jgi:hypothetical protein